MAFFGIGIHVLIALFFAIHAIRRGEQLYWLLILFSFPLLGSVVYFFAIYLPSSRLERGMNKGFKSAKKALINTIDPGKNLREAEAAFGLTPTAQNQMALANAHLENGNIDAAVQHFDACLSGPFSNDPFVLLGAAQAKMLQNQAQSTLDLLTKLKSISKDYQAEKVILLTAEAYAALGNQAEAMNAFAEAHQRFGGFVVLARYALWALGQDNLTIANELKTDIERTVQYWSKHSREINKALLSEVKQAYDAKNISLTLK